jgi:hypothetical protein
MGRKMLLRAGNQDTLLIQGHLSYEACWGFRGLATPDGRRCADGSSTNLFMMQLYCPSLDDVFSQRLGCAIVRRLVLSPSDLCLNSIQCPRRYDEIISLRLLNPKQTCKRGLEPVERCFRAIISSVHFPDKVGTVQSYRASIFPTR